MTGSEAPARAEPDLIRRARSHPERVAIRDADGDHSYEELLGASALVTRHLLAGRTVPGGDLEGERVAFLVEPGFGYAAVLWGIWRAGGIAVPLCLLHPRPELAHVLDDAGAAVLIADRSHRGTLEPLASERGVPMLEVERVIRRTGPAAPVSVPPGVEAERAALLLYTSGTTGRPKGVVHTHATLQAQIVSLVEAWGWDAEDEILHVLPLHHTHGLVNALLCALWCGAASRMHPGFDAEAVWAALEGRDPVVPAPEPPGPPSLFMGVPTMYVKLLRHWREADEEARERLSNAARRLRLAVSGSAALPVPVFEAWEEIAGEPLLERYGMTEIGMALSNPLEGERRPGHVGRPLPGVRVRLADGSGEVIDEEGVAGEIEVRGANVFREYWRRPDDTADAFRDGWFTTGDEALVDEGYYRILGRTSVDILNTGGYKVSALEVEAVLLRHPAIAECAVVGVEDPEWGERVCAAVVAEPGEEVPGLEALRAWGKERLAPYKVPSRLEVLDALPRNPLGKVTKPDVQAIFREEET